ncbi:MAG: SUMF1/EgtB/PvdO family nonheme iron enzyme [Planctomycetales bacterium]|nr:SUMF1/EgtB/PvdO family nonheme iron enzyme [Planctomycetales bacterium]
MDHLEKLARLRKALTMGRCNLLRWVEKSRTESAKSAMASFTQLAEKLRANRDQFVRYTAADPNSGKSEPVLDLWPQVEARIGLIDSYLTDGDVGEAMRNVVVATQVAWDHETLPILTTIETNLGTSKADQSEKSLEPSFLPLPSAVAGIARLENVLRDIASEHGWSHPGVLMSGEILAMLCGSRRSAELAVETRIMFAMSGRGILAKLRVERLPGGCGLLIPDPYRCGYLWLNRDFSQGLQRALWAARNYADKHFESRQYAFDWRWSLDLLSATDQLPDLVRQIQIPVTGRSAEVAFAVALIAAHAGNPDNRHLDTQLPVDPLDPHVSATATLGNSENLIRDELAGVGKIDDKTLINRLENKRLLEVVHAKQQDGNCIPPDRRYEFVAAASLAAAYQLMTRHPRITRRLNRHFAIDAEQQLQKYCTPWVRPDIREVVNLDERSGKNLDLRQLEPIELTPDQLQCLELGQMTIKSTGYSVSATLPADPNDAAEVESGAEKETPNNWTGNRVRIFADSGMGKSIYMLHCQRQIARSSDLFLPLRIGRTTENDAALNIRWNEGDLPKKLVELPSVSRAFDEIARDFDNIDRVTVPDRVEWFRSVLRQGRVVFLIDALDQIDEAVTGLGTFLGSADVRHCPVIMTGRWESLRNRPQAFQDNLPWRTLRMMPFDRDRQIEYLGDDLADELLLPEDEIEVQWNTNSESLRRHQWKDLLETPLLLNLIKQLATTGNADATLDRIHNRYDLYDRAIDHLVEKGWNSATEEQKELLCDGRTIRELLGHIAWFMVRQHRFSNALEGDPFKTLSQDKRLQGQILKSLERIDVTTALQVFDRADSKGLAFRHRSFLEFFAACHLMSKRSVFDWDSGKTKVESHVSTSNRHEVLDEIHKANLGDSDSEAALKRLSDWQDTLRFALGTPDARTREQLACELIERGNPWIVYQALKRDHITLPPRIESLCRWLVHRDFPIWFRFQEAVNEATDRTPDAIKEQAAQAIDESRVDIRQMTLPIYRDAAYLASLRELVRQPVGLYVDISTEQRVLEQLTRLPTGHGTWDFTRSFIDVSAGNFALDRYHPDLNRYHPDLNLGQISITSFALADFPITNALFELFCPSHRRQRDDQHSPGDAHPVIHVNWFMAAEFCEWLSALTGQTYRLPSEWEWEWACRWQDNERCRERYWWGPKMRKDLCWYSGWLGDGPAKKVPRTRSRDEAIDAFKHAERWHPSRQTTMTAGLLDVLGNVWEWCCGWYKQPGSYRVLRGGSWFDDLFSCECSYRSCNDPAHRDDRIGFRVCRD